MPRKDLISLFIERYLKRPSYSVKNTEFRAMLHDTVPALSPWAKLSVYHKLETEPLATSFIRIARAIGIRGIDASPQTAIKWAQLNTILLGNIDPRDQEDAVLRYSQISSELIMPGKIIPGLFYTYKYRAESVDDYDQFPMTLVLKKTNTHVLGMNFHYLPYKFRFALFEAMMPLTVPLPVSQLSRINITYEALKGTSQFEGSKPTIKLYRLDRFKSNAVMIAPIEWAVAMAFPSQEFIGKSQTLVWRESAQHI